MMAPVRVLIVDDSPSIRAALQRILSSDPEIEVVGLAFEPYMARAMIKDLNPDVVTLDIEMPGMNGLDFLERIMRLRPMPVVMCSTLTERGADATIAALRLGAVDCIAKPTGSAAELLRIGQQLCAVVKGAALASVRAAPLPPPRVANSGAGGRGVGLADSVVAIGASTGGVEALFTVLAALPTDCPPVLVVQHMPAAYTRGFAARLDKECGVQVVEAADAMPLVRGTAYVAPGGGTHMTLAADGAWRTCLRTAPPVSGHRPSVDVLFHSVARLGQRGVGVILTGMGADGAEGLKAMRAANAHTIGQDRASCVVYGMPRAAFECGAVASELPLSAIPQAIVAACRK